MHNSKIHKKDDHWLAQLLVMITCDNKVSDRNSVCFFQCIDIIIDTDFENAFKENYSQWFAKQEINNGCLQS